MKAKVVFSVICLLLLGTFVRAQEFRASISGHVTDSTGATVPQAKVQATNLATKETNSAVTDNSGSYTIPLLPPGMYKLTIEAVGFKQYVRGNISLEISQAAGIDAKLELGDVTQTVEVAGEAVLLETQTANRNGLIDAKEVSDLPLNSGRNPFMLGLTASGVTFRGASIWQRPFDNGAIANWVVNGGWQSNNEFLLDGAPNNAQMGTNNIAYVPMVETVQEFTMMQNTYDAQYGHTMGGILNTVMKSGGSQFHGNAWEFLRRSPLDANNFQNNAASVFAPKPSHYLDDYGAQVSGQVVIPKILKRDGYIKLFYMGAFQNYREATVNPLLVSWPTAEMRNGDFSKVVNGAGLPITIYDPTTAVYDGSGNILSNRQPFPGNQIPANRINPAALALTKLMPMPNTSTPGQRYATQDLSLPGVTDHDAYYNMTIKFDWTVGDKNRFFMREGSNDRTEHRPVNGIVGLGEDGQLPFQRINDTYVLDWTSTLNPTTVLDVRASNTRFVEKGSGFANQGFDLTSLGLPSSLVSQLPGGYLMGVWAIGGYQTLGRTTSDNITNSYGLEGSLTKVAGKHSLKAGVDIRRIQYLVLDTGSILEEDFNSTWTQQVYNNAGNGLGGDGYASFLLGYPSGGQSNYAAYPFYRQWYIAPYIQDDWKVNSRLTVNVGLRFDINAPITEKYNRLDYAFDPNVANPIGPMAVANIQKLGLTVPSQYASLYSNLANLKGGLRFVGVNGAPNSPANIDWTGIQPRIGFAFRLKDKLVMRGGYGMYVVNPNNDWMQTAGFSNNTPLNNSNDGGRTPIQGVMNNPFPNGINLPPGSSLGPLTFAGKSINWFNPDFKLPRSNQFSFGFQYQVNQNGTLDISYVGNRVAHTQTNFPFDVNPFYDSCSVMYGAPTPAGFSSPAAYCNQTLPNPFQGLAPFIGTSMYTSSTISLNQLLRQYPQFTGGTEYGLNDGHVWYNSLQVNYNYRMRSGLTLLLNYTLSKQNERWGYLNYYQNPIQYQEGLYYADRPHFIKATVVYGLPFGRGKHFLTGAHGVVDRLVSGWEVNSFITESPLGEPANMPGSIVALKNPGLSTVHWGANKVQINNNCILNEDDTGAVAPLPQSVANGCSATDWSQYAWLQLPPNYRPAQVNSYRSPNVRVQGTYTMDASLIKETRVTERIHAQFRAEAFNALNHWNYMLANVNNTATDPNFGSIIPHTQSTQNTVNPRSIQLGFKVTW
ncbi:MAG TPA: carboxypeptidase regulatory-like domain-containing protein [Candidatus Sulfopaludibacter sp.]|nr:carboxypeptidase regulatory-like domain-containing protein [Candidatus Sulfopaludibacter sp.]